MSRLIAKADVTYALQFTPYDATNPLGFQSAAQIAGILGGYPTTTVMNTAIAASRATVPLMPLLATVAQTGLYTDLSGRPPAFSTAFILWFNALPTTTPQTSGVAWNNSGVLTVSQG